MKNNYFFKIFLRTDVSSMSLSFICVSEEEITKVPLKETMDLLGDICKHEDHKHCLFYNHRKCDVEYELNNGWIENFSFTAIREWAVHEKTFLGNICENIKVYLY